MTFDHEEVSRLRKAFGSVPPEESPRSDCPAPAILLQGVRKELGIKALKGLVLHVASCPVCTEAWRLAEELEEDGRREEPQRAGPARWVRWSALPAAAMVVLVVGFLARDGRFQDPTLRGEETPVLELIGGERDLPRADFLARWNEIDGASYNIKVFSEGSILISSERGLERPEFKVPEEDLRDLASGSSVDLLVEAVDAEGELIVAEAFRLRLL